MNEGDAVLEDMLEDAAVDPVRELLEDEDTAYRYLAERWLTDVAAKLRDARREANLTQGDVAELLGTKQPAIARLERDHEGKFSLRRFVEYALACGALPFDLSLESAEELRRCALDYPSEPITETAYESWLGGAVVKGSVTERETSSKGRELGFADRLRDGSRLYRTYEPGYHFYANKGSFSDDGLAGDLLLQPSSQSLPRTLTERQRVTKNRAGKALDRQEFELAS